MQRRFFSAQPIDDQTAEISGPDAHHIANVIRLKPGDSIVLFDGSGQEFTADITEIRKKLVQIQIVGCENVSRELPTPLTIAAAIPKGDRQKVLIEKLVELGVTTLIPLNAERSAVAANAKSTDKMQRWVVEASKQCGRNKLMKIDQPLRFSELLHQPTEQAKWIAHPYGDAISPNQISDQIAQQPSQATSNRIAIGPEGGFTDEEINLAISKNWYTLSLGSSILRIETAACAAATLFGIGRT